MAQAMPFAFGFQVPGQEALRRGLSRFADEIDDWTNFWGDYFASAWYRHVQAHYETQGRSSGIAWAPLTQRYADWKQKHWPGLPMGVLSGALRESLTFPNDPDGIWEETAHSLAVGSRVRYAIYQQMGTRRMKARPPLWLTDEFMDLTAKLLQEYAVKTLRNSGA